MNDTRIPPRQALLSVVVPVYNNAKTLEELARRLLAQAEALFANAELLFVNDGSSDKSAQIIDLLCGADTRIRGIHFTRNFGQHAAMLAGLRHARGEYLLCIDADLEESPEALPAFVDALKGGLEIAIGVRITRRASFFKHWTAKAYYHLNSLMCDYPVQHDAANMRLMTRVFVRYLLEFSERPFFGGFTSWVGLPTALVPITWDDQGKKSGFTLSKLFSHARLGLVGFSSKLLRLSSVVGGLLSIGSAGFGVFLLIRYLTMGVGVPGFYTLALLCLLATGLFSIFLGILGEYVAEIYDTVKKRPHYLVRTFVNPPPQEPPACAE